MRLLQYVKIWMLTGMCMICFSCSKILDQEVIQNPVSVNAWGNPADAEKEVAAAYDLLRTAVSNDYLLFKAGDIRAHDYLNGSFGDLWAYYNDKGILLYSSAMSDWSNFYKVISQCNLILEKIEGIEQSKWSGNLKDRYTGETHFIRAFAYFLMVRLWGDVPLQLKAYNTDFISREKAEKVAVVIFEDLQYAAEHLQWEYSVPERGIRATKGAALTITAHAKAWFKDYTACEAACAKVINEGPYKLVQDTAKFMSIFIGKSEEGIFELNYSFAENELDPLGSIGKITLPDPYYRNNYAYTLACPPADVKAALFPEGKPDRRKKYWFVESTWNTTNASLGKYRTLAAGQDTASGKINESNIIITRLADVMLLRAEALAALGRNADAVLEVNKVRKRADTPLYNGNGNIKDTILAERRIELTGEGHRFFDLVRTGQLPKFQPNISAADFQKGAWLLPIKPEIVANSNGTIVQNEFWK